MSGSENMLAELVVGTYGWEHSAWLDVYYPDDLPEDWRLGYYANEFGCVVVPARVWGAASLGVIEQWLQDVGEDFMFFLELPDCPNDVALELAIFASRCAGALLYSGEPADWQPVMNGIPLLLSEDSGDLKCYRPVGQTETVLAWLAAGARERIELPVLREQIELALQGVNMESRLAFVIGYEAPLVENLQNTRVIAELLGA